MINLLIGEKLLTSLLGNYCSYATPIQLSTDFARDILNLSLINTEYKGLSTVLEFLLHTKKKKFDFPNNMTIY